MASPKESNPRRAAILSLLRKSPSPGLGVDLEKPPDARTPLEMAGAKMQQVGENFPAFVSKSPSNEYTAGIRGDVGGHNLAGKLTLGQREKQFEVIANNLGISPQELRLWLSIAGKEPSGAGAAYKGSNLSASVEARLPEGERSVSGSLGYDMGDAGSVEAEGSYNIDDPKSSRFMGTYTKRF